MTPEEKQDLLQEKIYKLLVVDDNSVNRLMLSRYVKGLGYQATLAENGRAAWEKIQAENYDLLLLDIEMPEMDGFEVLRRLKADPARREIPVIVISAQDEVDSVVRCIEMGAEDYLPKPFNPVLLKARLSACLEKKRLRDHEIEYLLQVNKVTAAAIQLRAGNFDPASLDEVARRLDGLGQLAVMFQDMARQVQAREQQLKQQVRELRVEINHARKAQEVAQIVESEYFQDLLRKARGLRDSNRASE